MNQCDDAGIKVLSLSIFSWYTHIAPTRSRPAKCRIILLKIVLDQFVLLFDVLVLTYRKASNATCSYGI